MGIDNRADIKLVEGCVVRSWCAFLLGRAAVAADARLQVPEA